MRGRFRPRLIALDCGKSNLDVGRGMPNQKHLADWTVKAAARPRKIWRLLTGSRARWLDKNRVRLCAGGLRKRGWTSEFRDNLA
jgi:hypothetical protein